METGAGFPEQFASLLRTHNAGLPRQEKSPMMAGNRRSPMFEEVAANVRRLFGSRGGGSRNSAMVTEEANGPLESDKDPEACASYKKSKKRGASQKRKDGFPNSGGGRVRGDG